MKEIIFKPADKIKAIATVASYLDSLTEDREYIIEIKEHRKKRSLNSNSYAWLLLDRLAAQIHESKEAVYRSYIKEIGGNSEMVTVKSIAVQKLCETWSTMGIGFVSDVVTDRNDGFSDVMLYYGSSTYNQDQMNRLLNLIVQDCETFGIETKDPEEIEQLVKCWGIE